MSATTRPIACALATLALALPAESQVRVRQGATEVVAQPIVGAQSVESFYAYGTFHPASSDTGLEASQASLLFFWQQTGGPLSLVFLHDIWDDGSGGIVSFNLSGLPAGSSYAVQDDPGGDTYLPDPPVGGQTTPIWNWVECCTDGAALNVDAPFCAAVDPQFIDGINRWQVLSGPSLVVTRTNLPSLSATTYLCNRCQQLTCPALVTASCDNSGGTFVPVVATGSSLCAGSAVVNDRTGGGPDASDVYPVGTTKVTFTLSDDPGFVTECETLVVVEDDAAPVIDQCPAPLDLACDGKPVPVTDPRVVAWIESFMASDACGTVKRSNDAPAEFPPTCGDGTVVHFTATDDGGQSVTCESTLTLADLDAPVVTGCPAAVTVECVDPAGVPAGDPRLTGFFAGFTASDDCGPPALVNDAPGVFPGACLPGATTAVQFDAFDSCMRSAGCASAVTVQDTTPPTVACPSDLPLECSAPGGVPAGDAQVDAWRKSAVASDACGPAAASDDVPPLVPYGCAPGKATPVTFTATDACSLSSTCQASLIVADTAPPTVSSCPGPITLECSQPGGVPSGAPEVQAFVAAFQAEDVCTAVTLAHDLPPVLPAACLPGALTPVTFTAADVCLNRAICPSSITVADSKPPAVTTCPGPLDLECDGAGGIPGSDARIQAWRKLFAAADVCGAVTLADDAPPFFPSSCGPGSQTLVTFRATDACGQVATCQSTVTVHDTTAPVPVCPAPLELECSGPGGIDATDPGIQAWLKSFTASDLCDGATLANDAPPFFPSGCGGGQATSVVFRATDACGLEATCTSTVTVRDTTPPDLTVPGPLELECSEAGGVPGSDPTIQAWLASAGASDVCDGATLSDDAPALFPSGCGAGTVTTVTFTAVDDCNNLAQGTATVTVRDTLPPVLAGCQLRPAAPPASPASPGSAPRAPRAPRPTCSGASSGLFTVECGSAADACDPAPTLTPRIVLTRHDVVDGTCVVRDEEVDVACGELLELVRLAPPCPARPPRSPGLPSSVRSDGIRVLRGEGIRLVVGAVDTCGNQAAPCEDDASAPGGGLPCAPAPPACPISACRE